MINRAQVQKIEILEYNHIEKSIFPEEMKERLSVIWNTGSASDIIVDGEPFSINTNCILFISEFHMEIQLKLTSARIIYFDKTFLSPLESLNQIEEFLLLFYGAHFVNHIPKITLKDNEVAQFDETWKNMKEEFLNISNPYSEALIRNSFQRMMLQSQKIHMENEYDLHMDFKDLKIIREFQYLVEMNFKDLTKVSDYAEILKISPKKISELFGCCYDQKASELIANRRNLYARKRLIHTQELVKNIAYELNFSDSQTFSHFFKKHNGFSPEEYRKQNSTKN